MKHAFSKPLISFRRLQGGQFGTLDVTGLGPDYVQLALGTDFVSLTRPQWLALRGVIDRFFRCEAERGVRDEEDVVIERTEVEVEEVEDVRAAAPARGRAARRRSANG